MELSIQDSEVFRDLCERFSCSRKRTLDIAAPLSEADMCIQSMADASPTRWHLAHTTWFYEAVVLKKFLKGYKVFDESYNYLFNSYYNAIGQQFPRGQRGTQTRPDIATIYRYREYVEEHIQQLFLSGLPQEAEFLIELGINHEQQHQELMLTDIKHALFLNPQYPSYLNPTQQTLSVCKEVNNSHQWLDIGEGIYEVGNDSALFSYDNECPRHKTYIHPFSISLKTVSNEEYLAFINDCGYQSPLLWLSDGWANIQKHSLQHPMYWVQKEGQWFEFTLHGLKALDLNQPVTHINYYEADAFAHWAGKRLPTEFEWEVAQQQLENNTSKPLDSKNKQNFYESTLLHPSEEFDGKHSALLGNTWEWTRSNYSPYPGFSPFAGEAAEYNGKFMCNQYVLRGGSCVTPKDHIRTTYRNFFYAHQAWQFTGIRLASDSKN